MADEAGAAVIAAHPYDCSPQPCSSRLTQRFAHDEALRGLVHRFELFNRTQLFGWVAEGGFPAVATGDFHRPEHLTGWKTLVPSAADEDGARRATSAPGGRSTSRGSRPTDTLLAA